MATSTLTTTLILIAVTILVAYAWYDAVRNEEELKEKFKVRFKKGARIGLLLSLCGAGIGYANTMKAGDEAITLVQFIFIVVIGGIVATLEIGVLNGLNPNPEKCSYRIFKRFVNFGWVVAIALVGFTAIYLPVQLSKLVF